MISKKMKFFLLFVIVFVFNGRADAARISEDFDNNGYSIDSHKYIQDGRLFFEGNPQLIEDQFAIWDGSKFAAGITGSVPNTNTFYDFTLSVDAYYEGKDDDYGFGLIACMTRNADGNYDFLRFLINNDGHYIIDMYQDNKPIELSGGWKKSSAIYTNGQKNTLTMTRNNTQFIFQINGRDVDSVPFTLTGFTWGHVGMSASMRVDAGFDNFALTTDWDGDGGNDDPGEVLPSAGSSHDNCFISNLFY